MATVPPAASRPFKPHLGKDFINKSLYQDGSGRTRDVRIQPSVFKGERKTTGFPNRFPWMENAPVPNGT